MSGIVEIFFAVRSGLMNSTVWSIVVAHLPLTLAVVAIPWLIGAGVWLIGRALRPTPDTLRIDGKHAAEIPWDDAAPTLRWIRD